MLMGARRYDALTYPAALCVASQSLVEQWVEANAQALDWPDDLGDHDFFAVLPGEIHNPDIGTTDVDVVDPVAVSIHYRSVFYGDSRQCHDVAPHNDRDLRGQPDKCTVKSRTDNIQFDAFETAQGISFYLCFQKAVQYSTPLEISCTSQTSVINAISANPIKHHKAKSFIRSITASGRA